MSPKPVSYKQKLETLKESILLMVLSNPALEHAIVDNWLTRQGYVVQDENDADKHMHRAYGVALPSKKALAHRAARRAEALKLHKRAQALKVKAG